MKTIIRNIFLGSVLLISSSCTSFLEENPSFISPVNFYQTVDDFDGALRGLYPQGPSFDLAEIFADYNDRPESAEQTGDLWVNNPGYGFWSIRNAWSGGYATIKNSTMILQEIKGKNFSETQLNRIIGEAKFMRAYAYFNLVQFYGDIPLRTVVVEGAEDIPIAKSSQSDIYQFILDDILDAETKLPEESQSMGRVNKYVAKAFLARIYLTSAGFPMNITANYAKAKEKAVEVINQGGYVLMPTFDKVFKTEKYTSETIWAQLFEAPLISSSMHTLTAPTGSQTAIILPTDLFVKSFDAGDTREIWGIKPEYTNMKGTKVIKRPYYNKYINEEYLENELSASSTNILPWQTQIIRLSEMYLIAAEAENESNGPDQAYQYINKVRERARMDRNNKDHVKDLKNLTKEAFREAVLLERKHELYAEGFAWFDLKRTQTFHKVEEVRGDKLNVPIGIYNNTWPISDFEILNNNIEQNPEYR